MLRHERTEGWAAGLRLAALSLAGHPDPARFAAEFSGSERTVAEYLLAEVLDRQREEVRRLLLRTSILERVNGELAGLLTGDSGGERTLQDLEQANAFVVSLDAARSWFRYHQMFAGMLALELRRTAPGQVVGLHRAASAWFAAHGYPVEAIRHAQAARDWGLAARLLADSWPGLYLDGQAATTHELLAGFPADTGAAEVALGAQLIRGMLELARGRSADALAAFRIAERLARQVAAPHPLARLVRAWLLHALVRLGETGLAERVLAGLGEHERDHGEMRIAAAVLRLAQDDPRAALAALAPVLDGSARIGWRTLQVAAFLLAAIAREALGEQDAAEQALERALDRAEPDGALPFYLLRPVPGLLERHARRRAAHAGLIAEIRSQLAGPGGNGGAGSSSQGGSGGMGPPGKSSRGGLGGIVPLGPTQPLSESELRVLRYLPTNLSAPEIAGELSVSRNTVKAHMRSLYAKLGTHRRAETVARARDLGLLAPAFRR